MRARTPTSTRSTRSTKLERCDPDLALARAPRSPCKRLSLCSSVLFLQLGQGAFSTVKKATLKVRRRPARPRPPHPRHPHAVARRRGLPRDLRSLPPLSARARGSAGPRCFLDARAPQSALGAPPKSNPSELFAVKCIKKTSELKEDEIASLKEEVRAPQAAERRTPPWRAFATVHRRRQGNDAPPDAPSLSSPPRDPRRAAGGRAAAGRPPEHHQALRFLRGVEDVLHGASFPPRVRTPRSVFWGGARTHTRSMPRLFSGEEKGG